MPQFTGVKRIRDITACVNLAETSALHASLITERAEDGEYSPDENKLLLDTLAVLIGKLKTLNASTGKREKGEGPALTPVGAPSAAKSAKKAGARRR